MLSIVESLKEFRTIILGHRIAVYTDHKNLRYDNFTTEILLLWYFLLKEYGPNIKYITVPGDGT